MSSLRQQVSAIIDTCKTVLAGKGRELPPVDGTTITIAEKIIEAAKAEVPDDQVLASVKLEPTITWTSVLAAMEIVSRSLPLPKAAQIRLNRR